MKTPIEIMTNRELYTEWEEGQRDERHFSILQEMAKRINQKFVSRDTPAVFKQYKLNGAGDQIH